MAEFPIVGIGSSAGGLDALQKLFGAMPSDSGMGFVVVAHLDPTQESRLAELLGRYTKMPVVQIEGRIRVEPDRVYVIAPGRDLLIQDGILQSGTPAAPRGQRRPVDSFLRSLAEDHGERAVGIILSGAGTNGVQGLRFIKAEGGIVLAQAPDTAAFQGMPRSAIATGVVDLVLPPEQMPEALLGLARRRPAADDERPLEDTTPEEEFQALLSLIRTHSGRDFRAYKRRTLLRRIHRRMGLHRIPSLRDYIQRLRHDPEEVDALTGDLTINVTGFFRDPEAWEELRQTVIEPLVRERPNRSAIRVWVPGCSTGEEAFTIAMLITEQADAAGKVFDLKLFATDVIDGVLATARAGEYPASISLDVDEERLNRFFEFQDDTYYVRRPLRDRVTFAQQNLLQDPPFSRLDLISCRNLLIYLEPGFQRRVLALFHFALAENGHLFLGPAETASSHEDLFQPVSNKWQIYRRVGPTRQGVVGFPLVGHRQPRAEGEDEPDRARGQPKVRPGDLMARALLDRYAPASVLIDPRYRVHYLHGASEDYLRPPSGEPSHDLLAMAREGLQLPLRAAVRRALEQGQEVSGEARVRRGVQLHPVRFVVTPLEQGRDEPWRLLVGFFERETPGEAGAAAEVDRAAGDEGQLQLELNAAREDLRLTVEQMEAANEELKATNEEICSINEELQASNEELETSREELQSLNEELNTVNNQLHAKVAELEERTADLNNLLNSTDVATLFLDRSLCIRWFTPAMRALFQLLPTDIGRPIGHLAQRFEGGDLVADVKTVLARLTPNDAEVRTEEGRWYVRHIVPYRTDDDRIDGVVVSFTEITGRKRWEQETEAARKFASDIVETVREPLLVLTPELKVRAANEAFYQRFRVDRAETEGRVIFELGNRQWDIPALRQVLEEVLPTDKRFTDFEVSHDFEGIGPRTMLLDGRRLDHVQLILLAIEDITERKRADAALRANEERLRRVLQTESVSIVFFDGTGTVVDCNHVFLHMTGYTRDDVEARRLTWRGLTPPEWTEISEEQLNRMAATGRIGPYEKEYLLKDGSRCWMLFAGSDLGDGTVVEFAIDISDRKRAEQERELLARELSHRVKNVLAVCQALAMQTDGRIDSIEQFRDSFIGRLQALARAHGVLLDTNWQCAELKALVEQAVEPYCMDPSVVCEIEGPSIKITPKQGLGLSLVLHELGTNAVKYGALSDPEGRLRIFWQLEDHNPGRRLRLIWEEREGPTVRAPDDRGFGTKLIEQACVYELEGEVELDYADRGLTCSIVFPLA